MTNHAKNYASTIYQSLVGGERPLRSGIYRVQKKPCWRAREAHRLGQDKQRKLLPKQVDRELRDTRDNWFWRQTLTIRGTWLCCQTKKVNSRGYTFLSVWLSSKMHNGRTTSFINRPLPGLSFAWSKTAKLESQSEALGEDKQRAHMVLPKQVDCEFKDMPDSWFWRRMLTTSVTWLCLSNQKGELTWSQPFLIAGFVVRASEWTEFFYSARRL